MNLRQMAVAILIDEYENALFLHKDKDSRFLPDRVVPIGGHLKQIELRSPLKACEREINEEASISSSQINNLYLKYIILRNRDDKELRIQYVFLGEIKNNTEFKSSKEGQILKIPIQKIFDYNTTYSTKCIINHYIKIGKYDSEVYIGTLFSNNASPNISWSIINDWE